MSTTAVPSKLPEDFALNIENLDKFTNSTSPTFTDRLGVVKKTITGVLAEYPNASGNAADAAVSAGIAMAQADISTTQAGLAATAKTQAETAQGIAFGATNIKLSTTAGITDTTPAGNKFFSVISPLAGEGVIVYENVGGAAIERKRTASSEATLNKFVTVATKAAFVPTPGYNGLVLIVADESHGGAATMNAYDGLTLRYAYTVEASPTFLYTPADRGGFFNVSEPGTVFKDSLGATKVTASGDKVGRLAIRYPNTANVPDAGVPYGTLAGWVGTGVTKADDAIAAPDGTITADKIMETASSGVHGYVLARTGKTVGATYRMTTAVKFAERSRVRVAVTTSQYVDVELTTLAILGQGTATVVKEVVADANGFVRISIEAPAAATTENISLYALDGAGAVSYAGVAGSGFHVAYVTTTKIAAANFEQPTEAKRPAYIVNGNKKALRFNAANSEFMRLSGLDLSGASKVTMVFGLTYSAATPTSVILECNAGPLGAGGGFGAYISNTASNTVGGGIGSDASNFLFNSETSAPAGERTVAATIVYDPLAAVGADRVRIRVGGAEVTEAQAAALGTPGTGAFAVKDLFLAARQGTSLFAGMDLYCGMFIDRKLTAAEILVAESWVNQMAGISQAPGVIGSTTLTPTAFTDSRPPVAKSGYLETSAFSRVVFNTDATSITINAFNNYFGSYPSITSLGLVVNGKYFQTVRPGAAGVTANVVALPIGNKTVEVWNGAQSRPNPAGTVIGTWVTSIVGNKPLTQEFPVPQSRILFYGDSITVGSDAADASSGGYPMAVRRATHRSVALEAWGSRSLHEDCVDATARTAFVAQIVAYSPSAFWLAVGTNDYGLNKWSAASFGTAYAALVDALHTALPSMEIYTQSPLVRGSEVANSFGNTTGDYRAQMVTVWSTRTTWIKFVDGTAIMTTNGLSDGVHPSSQGHALYANAVKAALGIT